MKGVSPLNLTGNAENRQELQGSVNKENFLEGALNGMKPLAGALNGLRKIRGYSAYEIALFHGFEGTEEEWLASMIGENGQDGVGITSITPNGIASNGNVYTIHLSDGTSYDIIAPKGADGTGGTGSSGGAGEDGGYYAPIVDDDSGELSWAASKPGMPPVGSANIKGKDGQDGKDGQVGQRGGKFLKVTTSPSSYTSTINGITPSYRIALSTVKSQAAVSDVIAGDVIVYSYYIYPVLYVDATAVYCGARVNIRGATGASGTNGTDGTNGKDGVDGADGKDGADGQDGYTPVRGSDYWTAEDIAEIKSYVDSAILGGEW